jgi:hypothetical protein
MGFTRGAESFAFHRVREPFENHNLPPFRRGDGSGAVWTKIRIRA